MGDVVRRDRPCIARADTRFWILDFGLRTEAIRVSLPEAPARGEEFLVDSIHERIEGLPLLVFFAHFVDGIQAPGDFNRLRGIHELLGSDRADRAVRNVGAHIAAMIRESDIVARLDDDRAIVVLPRAFIHDAWELACKICRTVETTPALLPELPDLTLSIGVAEFPACAENIYALLDAADHAVSMARDQGRNQAVAATTPNRTDPANLALVRLERSEGCTEASGRARRSGCRGGGKGRGPKAVVHRPCTPLEAAGVFGVRLSLGGAGGQTKFLFN